MVEQTLHSRPSSRQRRLWLLILLGWVGVIWGHSLVAGPQSSAESDFFVYLLRPLFLAVGVTSGETMTFVVRKCAHFTEYALLGVIVCRNVALWWQVPRRRAALLVPAAACVPFVDEWIQLSVPGRAGMFGDVLIDLGGLATGLLVGLLFQRLFQSR